MRLTANLVLCAPFRFSSLLYLRKTPQPAPSAARFTIQPRLVSLEPA
jgi:hypothetical protein